MKYIFIVNPFAGKGNIEVKIRSAIADLPQKEDCEVYVTKAAGDATAFVRKQCENRNGEQLRFIACGGDGTINEVFNGAVGYKNVSVSCYPCGSGNDFVKVFGGTERFTNIAKLLEAPVMKLDLLRVGDRYSNNVINFGFDTTVAVTINKERERTGHGNKNAYTKGVILALINSMKTECTVIADGENLNPDGKVLLCTLANGQYVGGSFKCAPKAKIDDGLMEVCLVKPISRIRFFKLLKPYTKGEHLDKEDSKDVIIYRQAKRVEVKANSGFAYSLDGEIVYSEHFIVEIAEGALDFAVPE